MDRQRGLRPLGPGQQGLLGGPFLVVEGGRREDHAVQGPVTERPGPEPVPDRLRGRGEHGHVGAHTDVLGALAREEERDPAHPGFAGRVVDTGRRGEGRVRLPRDQCEGLLGLLRQVLVARRDDREAHGVVRAEVPGALPCDVVHRPAFSGLAFQQGGRRRSAEQHQFGGGGAGAARRTGTGPGRGDVLLQGHVEVAAAEAEAGDRRPARMVRGAHPRTRPGVQVERAVADPHRGVGPVHLDHRGQDLVVQGQHALQETDGPGGGLRVADLRLDRAEGAPLPVLAARLLVHLAQRGELRGVPRAGTGTVRLHQPDGLRPVAGDLVGAPQRPGLARGHRRVDGAAPAVRRGADPPDDGVDPVAVTFGVGQPLQGVHGDALAQHGAVGGVGEGPAVAAG